MYILMYYSREDCFIGALPFNTFDEAKAKIREFVSDDLSLDADGKEMRAIDKIVEDEDLLYGVDDLSEDLGVEVYQNWTWARTFDGSCGVTDCLYVIQKIDEV